MSFKRSNLEYKNLGRLNVDEKYYKMIIEESGENIFVIDLKNREFYFSKNLLRNFGEEFLTYKDIEELIASDLIHNKDKEKAINRMRDKIKKSDYFEDEVRIKNRYGKYIWCSSKVYVERDENNIPVKVISSVRDIDRKTRERADLKKKAQKDLLTGLYNKVTVQSKIERYIKKNQDSKSALFVIDIDNFKGINDNLGHLFGDSVLIEISSAIKGIFGSRNIVGRIGGDEFVAFFKNIILESEVHKKANALVKNLRKVYQGNKISVSVGIAYYKDDGESFNSIFEKADIAAYYSKEMGKDCWHKYSEEMQKFNYCNSRDELSKIDKSERNKGEFLEYVFNILYSAKDTDLAINEILSLISRYYNIGHIVIYEKIDESEKLKKTYEYSKPNIEIKSREYSLIYDVLTNEEYLRFYNENGIFYSNNVDNLPEKIRNIYKKLGIHSILQSAITEDNDIKGFIAFSDTVNKRDWGIEEIDASIYISKVLSLFLLNKRKQVKLEKTNEFLSSVLEYENTLKYIIDKNTYNIIYTNKKIRDLVKDDINKKCYEAIRGEVKPCIDCPLNNITRDIDSFQTELYIKKYNIYTDITIIPINWDKDTDSYLFSCYDITKYKNKLNN